MKKVFLVLFTTALLAAPVAAQVIGEKNDTTEAWNNIKENGKDALKKTGEFFKSTGEDIKQGLNNLKEVKCIGTWSYKGKNCTTIITINDDGTMEIEQREGFLKSNYYKGTYSQLLRSLHFTVTKKGAKGWVISADEQTINNSSWYLTYSIQDDPKKMKFTSSDIPEDSDGTDFSKGVIFTKK